MSASGAAGRVSLSLDRSAGKQAVHRLGPVDVLVLAAWCGLTAGWLEVGTKVLLKSIFVTDRMYNTGRHFVWVVPLSNLLLFGAAGLLLAAATKLWARRASWVSPRVICAAASMPALMAGIPQVYSWAWLLLATGFAMRIAPWLERTVVRWRRWAMLSLPALLGLVVVVAGFVYGGDRLKLMREARRSLPAAASPNVLLIVLDTVRADRLSLYGYPRATTPVLKKLAERGIRFDEARATAPWTLPSHASMFTGYLPHELKVRWRTAFGTDAPTLAEHLGSRGYATAGFVANTQYCSYDAGLDRGFAHFADYPLDLKHLRPLRSATLFELAWEGLSRLGMFLDRSRYNPVLHWFLAPDRKDAGAVNREFTHWLSHRQDSRRPFFAFSQLL